MSRWPNVDKTNPFIVPDDLSDGSLDDIWEAGVEAGMDYVRKGKETVANAFYCDTAERPQDAADPMCEFAWRTAADPCPGPHWPLIIDRTAPHTKPGATPHTPTLVTDAEVDAAEQALGRHGHLLDGWDGNCHGGVLDAIRAALEAAARARQDGAA